MSDSNFDSKFRFTDNQGNDFDIWAGSFAEAHRLAQVTIQAHDANPSVHKSGWESQYDDALEWHNNRISDGSDPRSGLRGRPYVPWDENIDGVAAMMGGATVDAQSQQYPSNRRVVYTQGGARQPDPVRRERADNGGGCLVITAIMALVVVCGWAIIYSTIGG